MTQTLAVTIRGSGRSLPQRRITTAQIASDLGIAAGRLERATGVLARHVCETEDQISLATTASQIALDDSGMDAGQIDLLIFAAAVPYQPIPATAPLLMRSLGIPDGKAAAFDVNATCLSFVSAFDIAARQIATGAAQHVLVVSSEIASRALPWADDPETAALFGDGAAAVVLTASAPQSPACMAAMRLRSYPSAYEACTLGAGGTRFDFHRDPAGFTAHSTFGMDGKVLFRLAAQHFNGFVDDLLAGAGWPRSAVDLVVPHQASPAGLLHMIRQTGFVAEKVVNIAADCGNQIAASIPFAFDVARRDGRISAGDKVLLLGTSAGVSFGGIALVA